MCKSIAVIATVVLVALILMSIFFPPHRHPNAKDIMIMCDNDIGVLLQIQDTISFEDIVEVCRRIDNRIDKNHFDVVEGERFSDPKAFGAVYLLEGSGGKRIICLRLGREYAFVRDRSGRSNSSLTKAKTMIAESTGKSVTLVWAKNR